MADNQANRPHRPAKEKKKHTGGDNPKAFAFAKPGKLQKAAARSHDVCLVAILLTVYGKKMTFLLEPRLTQARNRSKKSDYTCLW